MRKNLLLVLFYASLITLPLMLWPSTHVISTDKSIIAEKCDKDICSIEIKNSRYVPDTLIVRPLAKIVWINKDDQKHTVTSGSPLDITGPLSSGMLVKDESYSISFEKPAEYPYFCENHPKMMGAIIVKGEPVPELPEISLLLATASTFVLLIVITQFRKYWFK